MSRIQPINRNETTGQLAATLDSIKVKVGKVPNLFATLALAPAALNAYLAYSDALSRGRLNATQREVLALAIGQANSCQYCLSAHTFFSKHAGLDSEGIKNARNGHSSDPLNDALATFAVKVVNQRGVLSDADINQALSSGLDDGLIVEVIAHVALNTLTNYTNHIAATEIDFPVVEV